MKRFFALLLSAAMLLTFCACGKEKEKTDAEQYTEKENQLSQVFTNAELIYSWFTGCNHISADKEDTRQLGDDTYMRVTQTGYATCEDLRSNLSKYFTEDIVTALMDTTVYKDVKLFVDIDGALYTYDTYVGLVRWDIGERKAHITEQDDARQIYHMDITYDYYNVAFDTSFDYEYVLCEDGQWRFSKFALPAALIGEKMYVEEEEQAN